MKMWKVAHKTERNKLKKDASKNNKEIKVKIEWNKTQVTQSNGVVEFKTTKSLALVEMMERWELEIPSLRPHLVWSMSLALTPDKP